MGNDRSGQQYLNKDVDQTDVFCRRNNAVEFEYLHDYDSTYSSFYRYNLDQDDNHNDLYEDDDDTSNDDDVMDDDNHDDDKNGDDDSGSSSAPSLAVPVFVILSVIFAFLFF